jgi:hypothetical protein
VTVTVCNLPASAGAASCAKAPGTHSAKAAAAARG